MSFFHRHHPVVSPEAEVAFQQASRALEDAQNLAGKVDKAARESAKLRRENHIAAAVVKSIRGS